MSSGSQTATSQQITQPNPQLQAANSFGFNQAKAQYNSPSPAYYPGSTVANQSPATQAANQGIAARAVNGSPLNSSAGGYLQSLMNGALTYQDPLRGTLGAQQMNSTANGDYLNPGNPYQGAVDKSISDSVIPTVESQFSAGGRYGSPSMGSEMTRQLADAIAPQHYQNYQNERGLQTNAANSLNNYYANLYQNKQGQQMQAAGMAPGQANQDWTDLLNLLQSGQGQDQYGQNLINGNMNQWNYNQNLNQNKLAQYMQLINSANTGNSSTTSQTTPGTSTTSSILGLLGGLAGGLL